MKKELQRKMKNNKGFSLVELIIVIAIMGVLIVAIAPQFIRYVEKSKYSTDTAMVNEVKNAIEVALADPVIYASIPSSGGTITFTSAAQTTAGLTTDTWAELVAEVEETIELADTALTSKKLSAAANNPTIVIDSAGEIVVNVVKFDAP